MRAFVVEFTFTFLRHNGRLRHLPEYKETFRWSPRNERKLKSNLETFANFLISFRIAFTCERLASREILLFFVQCCCIISDRKAQQREKKFCGCNDWRSMWMERWAWKSVDFYLIGSIGRENLSTLFTFCAFVFLSITRKLFTFEDLLYSDHTAVSLCVPAYCVIKVLNWIPLRLRQSFPYQWFFLSIFRQFNIEVQTNYYDDSLTPFNTM